MNKWLILVYLALFKDEILLKFSECENAKMNSKRVLITFKKRQFYLVICPRFCTGFKLSESQSRNTIYFNIILMLKRSHFTIFTIQNLVQTTTKKKNT